MDPAESSTIPTIDEFLYKLFEVELKDESAYDAPVVALVKEHLAQDNIHSRAGNRLAEALVHLAKERGVEKSK